MIEAPERGCFLRESGYSRRTADVAQLVEHFTRNEGVPGSSPGVGLGKALETGSFPSPPPLQEIQRALGGKPGGKKGNRASRSRRVISPAAKQWPCWCDAPPTGSRHPGVPGSWGPPGGSACPLVRVSQIPRRSANVGNWPVCARSLPRCHTHIYGMRKGSGFQIPGWEQGALQGCAARCLPRRKLPEAERAKAGRPELLSVGGLGTPLPWVA